MIEQEIPIYMYPLLTQELEQDIMREPSVPLFTGVNFYWGPRGRWLLSAVLNNIIFEREQEIAILTTSDDTYVSICVSVPCFNCATISRKVTERTRVILLIHEFGWVMDGIDEKIREWKKRGIIIIEDCAHIMGIRAGEKMVGEYGDYSIFSLPKIIPAEAGGLLVTEREVKMPAMDAQQYRLAEKARLESGRYISRINWFNRKRAERAAMFERCFPELIYEPSANGCPFFICLMCGENMEIRKKIKGVEFGATLHENKLYIPLNPLVPAEGYEVLINELKGIMKEGLK